MGASSLITWTASSRLNSILPNVTSKTDTCSGHLTLQNITAGGQDGSTLIAVAAGTVTIIEGAAMMAERYKREKFKEGRREGRQEILERLSPEERRKIERELREHDHGRDENR